MLNAKNGCSGVTSGSALGFINTVNSGCNSCGNTCDSCSSCDTCNTCNSCGNGWWSNWGGGWNGGSRFARSLATQLRMLYNTRVHITTFTCTLDVVLLDVDCEFIRVLDYCTGKIFLLRIDCICMIEQPIVPNC
ncbi:MAG TPA: hypothetical protein IAC59_05570 [Candidatus Fimadaptatus faecigallinarum]|uniref:Uncharacterized protein n=1 Tax=Candidatus Fimadaptatus faecigallinarum TaxID=2840814 RepID=A0A9D1LRM7_9FIRM|nr:hypothetical protein [Candidatus Fimadaptatus faecigallinarum]